MTDSWAPLLPLTAGLFYATRVQIEKESQDAVRTAAGVAPAAGHEQIEHEVTAAE